MIFQKVNLKLSKHLVVFSLRQGGAKSAIKFQTGGMFLRKPINVVEFLGSPPAMLDQP